MKRTQGNQWAVGTERTVLRSFIVSKTAKYEGRRICEPGSQYRHRTQQRRLQGRVFVGLIGIWRHRTLIEFYSELGRPCNFPTDHGNMWSDGVCKSKPQASRAEELQGVRPSHSTPSTGKPCTWGRGWHVNAAFKGNMSY